MIRIVSTDKGDGRMYVVDFGLHTRWHIPDPPALTWLVGIVGIPVMAAAQQWAGRIENFTDLDATPGK